MSEWTGNRRVLTSTPWGSMETRPALLDEIVAAEVISRDVYRVTNESLRGRNVVDCGANVGTFSALCAHLGAAHVLAVEPERENLELLRANTRHWPSVEIVEAAIGRHEGETRIVGEAGGAHTDPVNGAGVPVAMVTLTSVLDRFPLGVHVLKLDMEGAEPDALLSCSHETLARVRRIVLETHGPRICPWVDRPRVGEVIEHLLPTHDVEARGFPSHLGIIFAQRNGTAAPW